MKRHKFDAKPTTVDGIWFASKAEAKRYGELKLLQKYDKIKLLALQVPFSWTVTYSCEGRSVTKKETYVADFAYTEDGKQIVEDVKGCVTAVYRHKRKMMKVLLGIEIRETKAR